MNYNDKLREPAKQTKSIVCLGLDPVVGAMPLEYQSRGIESVPDYLSLIFEEMKNQKVFSGAFKPNQGFYLMHDRPLENNFKGSIALAKTVNQIKQMFPEAPIILDFKRGDIATSSANYAVEGFEAWKSDAVTVAPYMGTDSVMPFIDFCKNGKGVYVLNRTSNKGAQDFQNVETRIEDCEQKLYETVGKKIIEWAKYPGVGAVVGATSLEELSKLAKLYSGKDIPLLIPGVGGQGGKAEDVVSKLIETGYDLSLARINSSSGITHPWEKQKQPAPKEYAKVCVEELHKLNEAIKYNA